MRKEQDKALHTPNARHCMQQMRADARLRLRETAFSPQKLEIFCRNWGRMKRPAACAVAEPCKWVLARE
jgi:hypothetical protein